MLLIFFLNNLLTNLSLSTRSFFDPDFDNPRFSNSCFKSTTLRDDNGRLPTIKSALLLDMIFNQFYVITKLTTGT